MQRPPAENKLVAALRLQIAKKTVLPPPPEPPTRMFVQRTAELFLHQTSFSPDAVTDVKGLNSSLCRYLYK